MGKIEKIYGLFMATLLTAVILSMWTWAIFSALFEKDFEGVGNPGSRAMMYQDSAYFE